MLSNEHANEGVIFPLPYEAIANFLFVDDVDDGGYVSIGRRWFYEEENVS